MRRKCDNYLFHKTFGSPCKWLTSCRINRRHWCWKWWRWHDEIIFTKYSSISCKYLSTFLLPFLVGWFCCWKHRNFRLTARLFTKTNVHDNLERSSLSVKKKLYKCSPQMFEFWKYFKWNKCKFRCSCG